MNIFHSILVVVQIISAIAVIVLVLMQQGKGADMGAAFGSGSAGSLFGASGSANFLSRSTAVCATIFLLCTLGLAGFSQTAGTAVSSGGIMRNITPSAPSPSTGAAAGSPTPGSPSSGGEEAGGLKQQNESPAQTIPK